MILRSIASLALLLALPAVPPSPARRAFTFTYTASLAQLPESARRVAIWIPYPVGDEHQEISNVKLLGPGMATIRKDRKTGNSYASFLLEGPRRGPLDLTLTFDVVRKEHVARAFAKADHRPVRRDDPALARFLEPDRLVPLDARVRTLSAEVTAGQTTDLGKAHAIYDYVVSTMKYDKSGEGWGRGDILWACDAKRGNCTDFHALFIGLTRAAGIPARFSIGFPLPPDAAEGEVAGYHCWAEFWLSGYGWVPVDASEAAKHPEKKEYFFGAHDENRVQLSTGRDLVLLPPQQGEPLNFLVYPYVEVDGKPWKDVTRHFSFRNKA
ncbi:MAG TPA: transglutaminase-like domain-containing protein [Candidatus Polarisedimenticolaceae bacterium]|nr:transglutaminase-like domain-containing protein [Candidatus Polarisedimenticolaceae bacterium]